MVENQRTSDKVKIEVKTEEPFEAKLSPIIVADDSNLSGKLSNYELVKKEPDNPVSSVKRKSGRAYPSQMKTFRDILTDINDDEFKSFLFNENEIE